MKKMLVSIVVLMLILISVPVLGAVNYEILRIGQEDVVNNLTGDTATYRIMDSNRISKKVEINDQALKYMETKGLKLTVKTNLMTFTLTPETFKNQQWIEAVKSGDPLTIRLIIKKGSGTKVTEHFDEWYYNQLGLSRFGISAWELSGEILVAGIKKYDISNFADSLNIDVEYDVNASSNFAGDNNLGMYVLNEQTNKWDYQGGAVNREQRTISFDTKVPGLFIIINTQKNLQFSDIKGHWAESDIQFLLADQVVGLDNKSGNKFYPNQEITRAEFTGFLVRLLKITDGGITNPFKDINSNYSYYNEIIAASKVGLVAGVSNDSFAPNQKITREQMAVMMTRALNYKKVMVETNETALNKFNDEEKISLWAKDGVRIVSGMGLMNGKGLGVFAPKSFTTKGETAAILHRLHNSIE